MESITQDDIIILLKAVIQMANVDASFDPREKAFFEKLVYKGKVGADMVKNTILPNQDDIGELSGKLSSKRAKRAFLLTLATMALADLKIDPSEKKLLDKLTKTLNVGKVKLEDISFEDSEEMVLKLIMEAQAEEKKAKYSQQMSDIDILTR